jgi:pimeloyl-ACP methyl ester carboxylesterase
VLDRLERDYARFPKWLARVGFSPSTPREIVERWQNLLCTAEQEIAVADFRAADRFDGMPLAAKVRAPTLIVGGEDDLLAPPARQIELERAIAAAERVQLPRTGHMVMLEQPDPFFATLERFLTTIS